MAPMKIQRPSGQRFALLTQPLTLSLARKGLHLLSAAHGISDCLPPCL